MTRPIFPMLAAAAIAVAAFAQDPAQDETRRYDIRSLSAAFATRNYDFAFTVPACRPGGAGEESLRHIASVPAVPDDASQIDDLIMRLVSFACRFDVDPNATADRIAVRDGKLHVAGPPALHKDMTRVLLDLGAAVEPTVDVELLLLPPEALGAAPSAILDAAKIERVLAIAKPVGVLRTRVRPGSEAMFEAVARRAYVKDYTTEVAQHSKAFDPVIDVSPEGTRVSVRVDSLPDGAFHLTVRGQQSEADGPTRAAILSAPTAATLQLPRTSWAATSASARIPDRGALVIGNSASPRSAWAVRVFAPVPARPAGSRLVPISAATAAPLSDEHSSVVGPLPTGIDAGAASEPHPPSSAGDHRLDPELLLEDVHGLRPDGVEATGRRAIIAGRHLALDGDAKFLAAAGALAARLIDEATRGVTIEMRYGAVPAAGLILPAAEQFGAFAATLPHHASTAASYGDRVVSIAGQTHAYLKDRDVEIAEGSTIDDPIVDAFFTGLAVTCRILPSGGDRPSADLAFDYQELLELVPVPTGSSEIAELEMPRLAAVRGHVALDLPLGAWQLVTAAPLEGTDRQFVLMLRVAEP